MYNIWGLKITKSIFHHKTNDLIPEDGSKRDIGKGSRNMIVNISSCEVCPEAPYAALDSTQATHEYGWSQYFWETRSKVSAGLLGLARHLTHHKDLLQGFLDVFIHLTLQAEQYKFDKHYYQKSVLLLTVWTMSLKKVFL